MAGYRFGSKEGLFSFVVHAISEEWLHELTKATANKQGIDAIHAATDAHYRVCCVNPDSIDEIEQLHEGLKRTMDVLLTGTTENVFFSR